MNRNVISIKNIFLIIISSMTTLLSGCNGGSTTQSSQSNLSANQYINQLAYSSVVTQSNYNNQQVLSIANNTTLKSIQVSFYQSNNCGTGLEKTLILLPVENNPIMLNSGFYISTDNSNFLLCNLYSGSSGGGCFAEYNDVSSIKFVYNYQEYPGLSTLCLDAAGGGDKLASYISSGSLLANNSIKGILNSTTNLNNAPCTNATSCQYERVYYSSISRSCAAGEVKCSNGECKASLSQCTSSNQCPAGMVQCPNNSTNPECVDNVSTCSQTSTCPSGLPVRCDNGSCAKVATDCPPPPTPYSPNRFLCPDGSFAINSANCGTSATCPDKIPYKCWNGTCQVSASDCPAEVNCPTSTHYLCTNGSCASSLNKCAKNKSCPVNLPIQCPNESCAATVQGCIN